MTDRLRIKPGLSWFPAGTQWQTAMTQLSDGAFKLFVYACLHAERSTGRVEFLQTNLSRILNKSRRSIASYLQELQDGDFCSVALGRNQYGAGMIQIHPLYWPYEPNSSASHQPVPSHPDRQQTSYLQAIENFLQSRSCVRCRFSSADRELAQEWFQQGVELWRVEQAIITGCGRKYVAWLNGALSQPIGSLRYFTQVLHELIDSNPPAEYYEFNKLQVRRIEQRWLSTQNQALSPIQVPAKNLRNQKEEMR